MHRSLQANVVFKCGFYLIHAIAEERGVQTGLGRASLLRGSPHTQTQTGGSRPLLLIHNFSVPLTWSLSARISTSSSSGSTQLNSPSSPATLALTLSLRAMGAASGGGLLGTFKIPSYIRLSKLYSNLIKLKLYLDL